MSLNKSSILVKLTIRQWDGFKRDSRVSERVDEEFNTAGRAGNYNKRLLDKSTLAPITKISSKIRTEHNRMTLPWCYDGVSLLPSRLYFEYTQIMRSLKDTFDAQVSNLISQYPIHKANQATKLGGLFHPDDYPSNDTLRDRYEISYKFFPVPEASHFIIDLEKQEEEKIKAQLEQELQTQQKQATEKLYERVIDIISKLHERLSDPEAIFRDSLIENVKQLAANLPYLNLLNDPLLNSISLDIEQLLVYNPDELRTNMTLRREVSVYAANILSKIERNRV